MREFLNLALAFSLLYIQSVTPDFKISLTHTKADIDSVNFQEGSLF